MEPMNSAFRVYVIQAGDTGPVKVGYCRNMFRRLEDLQVACWRQLYVRGEIAGLSLAEAQSIEASLHRWLAEHHIRGEWFRVRALRGIFRAIKKNPAWKSKWTWHGDKQRPVELPVQGGSWNG